MSSTADSLDLSKRPPRLNEILNATAASIALSGATNKDGVLKFKDAHGATITLAPAITQVLIKLLEHIAKGEKVTLVAPETLLSMQEAADLPNASRPPC